MKVFLMSDLVVHELVSMQLEGKWLTAAQFAESAQLWISRHGQRNQLSKRMLEVFSARGGANRRAPDEGGDA
ncbi:hypothetical protein [Paraburkholderia hospita]|jgi:hypothetical protein|uniref:hypothetical protein n=1 Tax=Paraburkholderia hospita TaxID=169430 RepID=UPI0010549E4F|nr:hypothetical protein [Paraburkholderia hospita]